MTNTHVADTYSVEDASFNAVRTGLGPIGASRFAQSCANYYRKPFWVVPGNDGAPIRIEPMKVIPK